MRDYSKLKEHMDAIDEFINDVITNINENDAIRTSWIYKFMKRWRTAHYDSMTFMFYAICLIHWQGEDNSIIVPTEIVDWFEWQMESKKEEKVVIRIQQEDLDDGSMKLTLAEVPVEQAREDEEKQLEDSL